MKLSLKQKTELFNALYYLKMGELKALCLKLGLPYSGKKGQLIDTIKHFVNTGKVLEIPEIPAVSYAEKDKQYPLTPNTKMLLGSYKNDAKTRAFFKKLIGSHFHFTAFGIDWLNDRWQTGKPPTYQEFADIMHGIKKERILYFYYFFISKYPTFSPLPLFAHSTNRC